MLPLAAFEAVSDSFETIPFNSDEFGENTDLEPSPVGKIIQCLVTGMIEKKAEALHLSATSAGLSRRLRIAGHMEDYLSTLIKALNHKEEDLRINAAELPKTRIEPCVTRLPVPSMLSA